MPIDARPALSIRAALALALPPCGAPVQIVARFLSADIENDAAILESVDGAHDQLDVDTSLIPPADVHALSSSSLVHVFGTLVPDSDEKAAGSRRLRVDLVRAVPGASAGAWEAVAERRAAFLLKLSAKRRPTASEL
jgi:hypothetical protein